MLCCVLIRCASQKVAPVAKLEVKEPAAPASPTPTTSVCSHAVVCLRLLLGVAVVRVLLLLSTRLCVVRLSFLVVCACAGACTHWTPCTCCCCCCHKPIIASVAVVVVGVPLRLSHTLRVPAWFRKREIPRDRPAFVVNRRTQGADTASWTEKTAGKLD